MLAFACALGALGMAQAQAPTEILLHSFAEGFPTGANPYSGVIRDSAGNLYGTTYAGGAANAGVVYRVNTAGRQTVLYSFTGGADGGQPQTGVIRDSAGNLYGTTYVGGASGYGVVYKVDAAGQETVLYSFTGGADGGWPYAGVIRDSAGNLYGTTSAGGTARAGVVFKLDTAGNETVLYNFTGGTDGGAPIAGVVRDSAGNLYGTAGGGIVSACQRGCGVVYKLDTAGRETVLYTFTGGADGANPSEGVIGDSAGNLYGTTSGGGLANAGVVYKLDKAGHETVLYSFTGGADGGSPFKGVIRDSEGNLYGTASSGGTPCCAGVVFKVSASGQETVLYTFTGGTGGSYPNGVIRDSAGNLYGTTGGGGTANVGMVYMLDAAGQETVLYGFPGPADGSCPQAGVIRDSAGNLYGTTVSGGLGNGGVVYKLDAKGHETVLYSFTGGADGGGTGGAGPWAGVIRDSAGNLYGTTGGGGQYNYGVVYKLDAAGHETVLHAFSGGADGSEPNGVILDSAGNLYGTTFFGGTGGGFGGVGGGVVYKLDTAGNETVLYSFTSGSASDGDNPYAGVIRDTAGNLYGTVSAGGTFGYEGCGVGCGGVYELDAAGNETWLCIFIAPKGYYPYAGVILDSAGDLYGTAVYGGTGNSGVVYSVGTPSYGGETVLYNFTGLADGGAPYAGVIRDSAGNLYGTTMYGGTAQAGVVYKLDTAGHETVLYSFTGGIDGGNPSAGVIGDQAGNLYGTTTKGGKYGGGVVYVLTGVNH